MGKSVDLAIKPEKITPEQLQNVQKVVDSINRAQFDIGMIEAKKHSLLHTVVENQQQLTVMQSEFKEQYGTYDINLQDGTIKYNDNVETNKED